MKLLKRFVPVLLCGVLFAAAAAETELKLWSFGKTDPEVTLRNGGTLAFDPLRDSSGNPVLHSARKRFRRGSRSSPSSSKSAAPCRAVPKS